MVLVQTQPLLNRPAVVAAQKRAEMPSCAVHGWAHAAQRLSVSFAAVADISRVVGLVAITFLTGPSFVYTIVDCAAVAATGRAVVGR